MFLSAESPTRQAIIYQSLFLANLLLLPGISFLLLVWLYVVRKDQAVWVKAHLYRALQLSIFVGVVIAIVPLIILFFSSNIEVTVMIMLVYFVTFHAGFVLIGILNLSRAMADKPPVF